LQDGGMEHTLQYRIDSFVLVVEALYCLYCPQTWTKARLVVFPSWFVVRLEKLDWIQEVDSVEVRWDYLAVVVQVNLSYYDMLTVGFGAEIKVQIDTSDRRR